MTVTHQYDPYTLFPDRRVAVPHEDPEAPTLTGDFAADLLGSPEALRSPAFPTVAFLP
ncbi:hypothetical protein ABZ114_08505 [Streptomyces albidoflavus]|uniref:hypothetical protein n=1 Tax=Streptomyces TaxID=1883 RepID=UPI001F373070|nr:hypothetical protein [Streptomyces sp. KE1]